MRLLAIETSCDETALAVVDCKLMDFKILAERVASQIPIHRPFGGVVPTLAKREHLKNLPILLSKVKGQLSNVNCIAVTIGPGLEPALWTGINFANELGKQWNIPVVGVNHLEGHVFSNWIPSPRHPERIRQLAEKSKDLNNEISRQARNDKPKQIAFPAIVLLVSGGHTILLLMESMKKWHKLGETRDDAVGEAFDKVAKMLGLPYPGGPEVEKFAEIATSSAAKAGTPRNDIPFPRPMLHTKNYDFSFSGLKTAVLYYLKDSYSSLRANPPVGGEAKQSKKKIATVAALPRNDVANVAAAFQQAAIDVLVKKTMRATEEFDAKSVLLCGGVAANKALQERLADEILRLRPSGSAQDDRRVTFHVPPVKYNTDNAVMIAAAACWGNHYPSDQAQSNLSL